ncbi:MAG: helix-turn-helix domain-containing protein [Bacteroidales bacterium]|jgi:hypothetical protein|nr:helix-turn-helix domain-containing protein [Bacteroidales bacterium]
MQNLILDVAKEYPNLSVTLTTEQLMAAIDYAISRTRSEIEEKIAEKNAIHYYSPAKTAELLDVHITTLWRWNRDGYLKHVSIGGARKYRSCDIDKILEG